MEAARVVVVAATTATAVAAARVAATTAMVVAAARVAATTAMVVARARATTLIEQPLSSRRSHATRIGPSKGFKVLYEDVDDHIENTVMCQHDNMMPAADNNNTNNKAVTAGQYVLPHVVVVVFVVGCSCYCCCCELGPKGFGHDYRGCSPDADRTNRKCER
ncbi:unnamed protein product, partial [Polarella glacialis]